MQNYHDLLFLTVTSCSTTVIQLLFSLESVIPNLCELHFSVEHNIRHFEK